MSLEISKSLGNIPIEIVKGMGLVVAGLSLVAVGFCLVHFNNNNAWIVIGACSWGTGILSILFGAALTQAAWIKHYSSSKDNLRNYRFQDSIELQERLRFGNTMVILDFNRKEL